MTGFPLRTAARFAAAFSRVFFSATAAANFLLGVAFTILVAAGLAGADLAAATAEVPDAGDLAATFVAGTGLIAADFTGADLAAADLTGADLTGADLTRAGTDAAGFAATGFAATGFADAIGLLLPWAATVGVDTDFPATFLVEFAVATAASPSVDFLATLRSCPFAFVCMFVFAI